MAQAKTLTAHELRKVLSNLPVNRYRVRNRLMLLLTHWAGMRVGEVAALRVSDVRAADGAVKPEIHLDAAQTKGKHARTVFLNDRLRKEIAAYLKTIPGRGPDRPLFMTQKRSGFTATCRSRLACNIPDSIAAELAWQLTDFSGLNSMSVNPS